MRIAVFSHDTFGDLILREPLFRTLLDANHEVAVILRPTYAPVLEFIDTRLVSLISGVNPYAEGDASSQAASLRSLEMAIRAWAPEILLFPMFNRSAAEALLADRFQNLKRIGLDGGPKPIQSMDEVRHLLGWSDSGQMTHLSHPVFVEEHMHECAKYRLLLEQGFGLNDPGAFPILTGTPASIQKAKAILATTEISGPYALFAVSGTVNVSIKAMPRVIARESARITFTIGKMDILFTGVESERAELERLREDLLSDGVPSAVWIGQPSDFDTLTGLVELSSLYCGSDTGPMHLAAAFGKPVAAIFGGGTFPRFLPCASTGFVATQRLPCFGCNWSCVLDHVACIDLIDPFVFREGLIRLIKGETSGLEVHQGVLSENEAYAHWRESARRRLEQPRQLLEQQTTEIIRLNAVNAEIAATNAAVSNGIAAAESNNADLRKFGATQATLIEALQVVDKDELAAQYALEIKELQGRLLKSEKNILEKDHAISQYDAKLLSHQQQLQHHQDRELERSSMVSTLEAQIIFLQKEICRNRDELGNAKKLSDSSSQRIRDLTDQLAESQISAAGLRSRLDVAEREDARRDATAHELFESIALLRVAFEKSEEANELNVAKARQFQRILELQNTELLARVQQINSLTEQLAVAKRRESKRLKLYRALREVLVSARQEQAAVAGLLSNATAELKVASSASKRESLQHSRLGERNTILERELALAQADISSSRLRVAALEENLQKISSMWWYRAGRRLKLKVPLSKIDLALVKIRGLIPSKRQSLSLNETAEVVKANAGVRFFPTTLPDGRPWPRISIITPSFNQGEFIEETIVSVLSQNYPNVEHIVIDGASTDGTREVLKRYSEHLSRIVSEPDRGQSHAINKGMAFATGEILTWLNSDDQLAPDALFAAAYAFAYSKADMISGICEVFRDGVLSHRHITAAQDGPLPLSDLLDLDNGWNAGQFFYQPEVLFTKSLWDRSGGHVREDLFYSMDYELWLRFAAKGAVLHGIGRPIAKFRLHQNQKTAIEENFKSELVKVRDSFCAEHEISWKSARPEFRPEKSLKVAFVNDVGWKYGAGIAHERVALGFKMAGHEVQAFALRDLTDVEELENAVTAYRPDLLFYGNLHAASVDSLGFIERLGETTPSLWMTHDFWLLTGRCAYPGPCTLYLTGCDASCPTANEYPSLAPIEIRPAWEMKQRLLTKSTAPIIVGNSKWALGLAERALQQRGAAHPSVPLMRIGVPTDIFYPMEQSAARAALGIGGDRFVLLLSLSILSDVRKGSAILLDALRNINIPRLTLLLVGNLDIPVDWGEIEVVTLGYLNDTRLVNTALCSADLLVGSSVEETLGQTFLEAAAAGVPAVGFRATGLCDSMIEGTTSFVVNGSSSAALQAAIADASQNRDRRQNIGFWARLHAENEWSLEAAWRVNFGVLSSLGIVDDLRLRHYAGLRKGSSISSAESSALGWIPFAGLSSVEGPYPDLRIPYQFSWVQGKELRGAISSALSGDTELVVRYHNPFFEYLRCELIVNGKCRTTATLPRTEPADGGVFVWKFEAMHGLNSLTISFDQTKEPSGSELRCLTVMLLGISLRDPRTVSH